MPRFETFHDAGASLFRSKRIWLLQLIANPLLFAAFAGWLLLPVATEAELILNGLVIILIVAAGLAFHGGTLNFYFEQSRREPVRARDSFRCAARNIFAIASCAGLVLLLWALLDSREQLQFTLPLYVRSLLPGFVRRHLEPWWLQIACDGLVFVIRWVVIPGLVLPMLLQSAGAGFRAFGRVGGVAVINSAKQASYWLVLLFAALLGYVAPAALIDWTPEFTNPTLRLEALSLGARLAASYFLALASWLLVCSILGRLGRPAIALVHNAAGNAAA